MEGIEYATSPTHRVHRGADNFHMRKVYIAQIIILIDTFFFVIRRNSENKYAILKFMGGKKYIWENKLWMSRRAETPNTNIYIYEWTYIDYYSHYIFLHRLYIYLFKWWILSAGPISVVFGMENPSSFYIAVYGIARPSGGSPVAQPGHTKKKHAHAQNPISSQYKSSASKNLGVDWVLCESSIKKL